MSECPDYRVIIRTDTAVLFIGVLNSGCPN